MENTREKIVNSALLVVASVIWGISFVVQSVGVNAMGSYTFNTARMLLGALVLLIAVKISDKKQMRFSHKPKNKREKRRLYLTGLACGIFLCIATNMQQIALALGASAGRAGFLTAIYIILVPILALIFFKEKCGLNIWIACFVALGGLYLLSIHGDFAISLPDLLLLGCAVAFSFQILIIGKYGRAVDSLRLSGIEFFVCGVLTLIPTVIFEIIPAEGGFIGWLSVFSSGTVWLTIMYMGVFSCGVGYTLQVIGQRNLSSTVASLIMSMESVFSAVFGWIFLKQSMSLREIAGCLLIFAAMCLAQITFKRKDKKILGKKQG